MRNLRFSLLLSSYGCILAIARRDREKGTTMNDYDYDVLNAELDAMVSRTMSEYDEAGAKVVYCEHNVLGVTFAAVLGDSGTVYHFDAYGAISSYEATPETVASC